MKTIQLIGCLFFLFITYFQLYAQKPAQGKIIYLTQYTNSHFDKVNDRLEKNINKKKSLDMLTNPPTTIDIDDFTQHQEKKMARRSIIDSLPREKEQVIYFKNDKIFYLYMTHISKVSGDTLCTISLTEADDIFKITIAHSDVIGRQAIKRNITNTKMQNNIVKIEYATDGETKDVLGYRCKKAIVTKDIRDSAQKMTVYYTEDIPNVHLAFKGLKGMALLIENEEEGYVCTATAISFEPIPDEQFEIPKGYRLVIKE